MCFSKVNRRSQEPWRPPMKTLAPNGHDAWTRIGAGQAMPRANLNEFMGTRPSSFGSCLVSTLLLSVVALSAAFFVLSFDGTTPILAAVWQFDPIGLLSSLAARLGAGMLKALG